MAIASGKDRVSTEESRYLSAMPWALTAIVSVGIISLSGFWIVAIFRNLALADKVSFSDLCLGVAGILLALMHVGLHTVAVFLRRQWAASTVVVLLGLEGWLLAIACFDPEMILIGLAIYTVILYLAMCYWRYKAFNYPSFFILFEGILGFFEGR